MKNPLPYEKIVDFADTQFSSFVIEYLYDNEKVCATILACSYGAQVESYKQKNTVKNLMTLSF